MFGYVEWAAQGAPRKRAAADEYAVGTLRFRRAAILRTGRTPELLARRRAAAAARNLARLGVTRAVFPKQFPYGELFARFGTRPVETLPLYRAAASELVRAVMAERGLSPASAVIAVTGEQLTPELRRTVTELCLRCRYVLLDAGSEGADFCRTLRREYGVSLVIAPTEEQLNQADVRVEFSPGDHPAGREQAVLTLCPGAEEKLPPLARTDGGELPEGCDRAQLLAALWEAGALRTGQIGAAPPDRRDAVPPEAPVASPRPAGHHRRKKSG